MDTLTQRRLAVIGGLLLLLVIAASVPFPQSLRVPCYLESASVWYFSRTGAAELATGYEKNLLNAGSARLLFQFNRPDFVEVRLNEDLQQGSWVLAGDTIAVIESHEGLGRYRTLAAALQKGQLEREALLAGARLPDVEVAQADLNRARVALEAYHPEWQRLHALYDSGYAAASEWQLVDGQYRLLEAEWSLAQANVRALQSGARSQDVDVAQANVEYLRQSLAGSETLLGRREVITTPLGGRLQVAGNETSMIRVEHMDTLAVIVSLPESVYPALNLGKPIEVRLWGDPQPPRSSTLLHLSFFSPDTLSGAVGVGLISNLEHTLLPGMSGIAKISLGPKTLLEALRLKLRF